MRTQRQALESRGPLIWPLVPLGSTICSTGATISKIYESTKSIAVNSWKSVRDLSHIDAWNTLPQMGRYNRSIVGYSIL